MNSIAELHNDDLGVSPVVSVIFLIAIAVIVTATIGISVLGLSDSATESAPRVQFEITTLNNYSPESDYPSHDAKITAVKITHVSGEDVDSENLRIEVDGKQAYASGDQQPSITLYNPGPVYPWQDTETISTGQSTTLLMATAFIEGEKWTLDPADEHVLVYDFDTSDGRIGAIYNNRTRNWERETEDDLVTSGQEVRIIWDPGNGESHTLQTAEISSR